MAVLEAWAYELPVIMTPQCNLPDGFEAGAALRAESEPESIAEALAELFTMSEQERSAMGRQGRNLAERNYSWNRIGREMVAVYEWVQGQGPKPGGVISEF